jgi:hypothetical protein
MTQLFHARGVVEREGAVMELEAMQDRMTFHPENDQIFTKIKIPLVNLELVVFESLSGHVDCRI